MTVTATDPATYCSAGSDSLYIKVIADDGTEIWATAESGDQFTFTRSGCQINQPSTTPTATPATFMLKMSYRECFPYDFTGPEPESFFFYVGDEGLSIDYLFDV